MCAVAVDCDGVLVDSESLSGTVLSAMLAEQGIAMIPVRILDGVACARLDGSAVHQFVSAYDPGAWKPDPTVNLVAAAGLGVPPGQCVAVEDSTAGIRAASSAGIRVIHYCRDRHIPTHAAANFRATSHLITAES